MFASTLTFMPSRLFYLKYLISSIANRRDVRLVFITTIIYNKRKKNYFWKQRMHYGLENASVGFIVNSVWPRSTFRGIHGSE